MTANPHPPCSDSTTASSAPSPDHDDATAKTGGKPRLFAKLYFDVMRAVREGRLNPTQGFLFAVIVQGAFEAGSEWCPWSYEELGERIGLREGMVAIHLKALIDEGFIESRRRRMSGQGKEFRVTDGMAAARSLKLLPSPRSNPQADAGCSSSKARRNPQPIEAFPLGAGPRNPQPVVEHPPMECGINPQLIASSFLGEKKEEVEDMLDGAPGTIEIGPLVAASPPVPSAGLSSRMLVAPQDSAESQGVSTPDVAKPAGPASGGATPAMSTVTPRPKRSAPKSHAGPAPATPLTWEVLSPDARAWLADWYIQVGRTTPLNPTPRLLAGIERGVSEMGLKHCLESNAWAGEKAAGETVFRNDPLKAIRGARTRLKQAATVAGGAPTGGPRQGNRSGLRQGDGGIYRVPTEQNAAPRDPAFQAALDAEQEEMRAKFRAAAGAARDGDQQGASHV